VTGPGSPVAMRVTGRDEHNGGRICWVWGDWTQWTERSCESALGMLAGKGEAFLL